jgi:hypothetical protein
MLLFSVQAIEGGRRRHTWRRQEQEAAGPSTPEALDPDADDPFDRVPARAGKIRDAGSLANK